VTIEPTTESCIEAPTEPLLHVVLHEPEIPPNTGTIGRMCVGFGLRLHLIQPLGFDLDEKALRRAGLDYWPRLDWRLHDDWAAYEASTPGARRWWFTTRAGASVFETEFQSGDHLVFGKETVGLPASIVAQAGDRARRIPLRTGERSLNLACAASIACAEAIRRCLVRGEAEIDAQGCLRGTTLPRAT